MAQVILLFIQTPSLTSPAIERLEISSKAYSNAAIDDPPVNEVDSADRRFSANNFMGWKKIDPLANK